MHRVWRVVASLMVLAGVFSVGWWAGHEALSPPSDPLVAARAVTVTAQHGEVGSSLELGGTATWEAVGTVRAITDGTVTAVADTSRPLGVGDQIVQIDLNPVVLAEGTVPAFRTLEGGQRGADVMQLQQFLAAEGFYGSTVDGEFDDATAEAVSAWRAAEGLRPGTEVPAGMIVFVPELPVDVRLTVHVGDLVGPGATVAEILGSTPNFQAIVTEDQLAMVPEGTAISLRRGGDALKGIAGSTEVVDGTPYLAIEGEDGGPVCPGPCQSVPREGTSRWDVQAVLVPSEEGVVLPLAAVHRTADGGTYVVTEDGGRIQVETGASSAGQVIVVGVDAGTVVQLPTAGSTLGQIP
jgi:peptidoglycan hydrolase-like protein with peptidoglycan-binding domain